MKKKLFLLILITGTLISCHTKSSYKNYTGITEKEETKITDTLYYYRDLTEKEKDEILDTILNIPEIRFLARNTEKYSNNEKHLSALLYPNDTDSEYWIKVGINGDEIFETFYNFFMDKKTKEITVMNPTTSCMLTFNVWKKIFNQYYNGNLRAFDTNTDSLIILQLTKLPFDFRKWTNWYKKQDYYNLPEKSKFNYYKATEDIRLLTIINKADLHEGLVPYLYFVLKENDNFKSLLLFSRFLDKEYPYLGDRDKFYDIITIRNDSVISSLYVGFLPSIHEDGKSFSIDKDLTIKVYDELTAHDSAGPVPIDTLKTSTYKIQDDGMIKEIK